MDPNNFWWGQRKNYENRGNQIFGWGYQIFRKHYTWKKFGPSIHWIIFSLINQKKSDCSPEHKFGCLNPHHLLVGFGCKNEGSPDQNFVQLNEIAVWLSQPPESAYKMSMSVKQCTLHFTLYLDSDSVLRLLVYVLNKRCYSLKNV